MTWRDPGPSLVVLGRVLVEGLQNPVLTLLPGLSVTFAFGAGFVVGKNAPGGLTIGAASGAPVSLVTTDPNGWAGIVFFPSALSSELTNAVLENCGSYNDSGYGQGCIFAIGNSFGTAPAPVLRNVTIRRAVDAGVALIAGGRLGTGSNDLVITETRGSPGSPFSVYGGDVSSIPSGQYTGNERDVIWILNGEVARSQSWGDHGVPYSLYGGLLVGHATEPILTLEAGVVMHFAPGAFLAAGVASPGGLRALGTDGNPVVLTGDFASRGAWMGVHIGPRAPATTVLDHVIVENAGGDDGQIAAAIRIARDYGEIVQHTTIRGSAGCGITRMSGATWTTDFTAAHLDNTFADNAGPNQCGP